MTGEQPGPRPYVDRPVTDGVAAAQAAASAASGWGLPEPTLLRVGMNAIFRCGDVVLRVAAPTAPASLSLELAALLERTGVAVPSPRRAEVHVAGDLAVTAWGHLDESDAPVDWREVGADVQRVHGLAREELPPGLPTPSPVHFAWWDFERLLVDVGSRLDAPARRGIEAALERHRGWDEFGPEDVVVCHGDVHPGNVIQTADGPVLIDWDLLCLAPAGWDHAPLMTWSARWGGAAGMYESFAEGYGASLRNDRWAEPFAELRLVAATLMRVKASLRDESAWHEADRRLALWRGDADAPVWRAI